MIGRLQVVLLVRRFIDGDFGLVVEVNSGNRGSVTVERVLGLVRKQKVPTEHCPNKVLTDCPGTIVSERIRVLKTPTDEAQTNGASGSL